MLKSIRFKFGPTPDSDPIEIRPGAMTVIVGPNNSGKSLLLRELAHGLKKSRSDWDAHNWKILAEIVPGLPPSGELRQAVLNAVKTDLARLRGEPDQESTTVDTFISSLGLPKLPPEQRSKAAYWLSLLNKKNRADTLIGHGKLCSPSTVVASPPPDDFLEILQNNPDEAMASFIGWVKGEERAILELIRAVIDHSDETLITDGLVDLRGYHDLYRKHFVLLDGKARLELAHRESTESLRGTPQGTIMRLWHTPRDLERLRELVFDAFDQHLCVDIMDLRSVQLVLSARPPPPGIEHRLDTEARRFFADAQPLDDFSDGVRTYIGLHAELLAQDRRYIMIDEPEAFLHPPLARRLGYNLCTLAAERSSCVFAATHSPDFLMGCIESGVGVNIVRLGYRNGIASAHLLPREELETMMVDPLLRSTGILGALFHQAAIVVEGDSDRTFYSEVNERLRLHESKTHPAVMRDCVFLNAQGKHTVSRVLAALRRLGVLFCGIVDLDLLKNKGECKKLLEATGATEAVAESIGTTRGSIQRSISDLDALCRPNGLARATNEERKSVEHFIREMEAHGIFLPEVGPVEGWLTKLGVKASKNSWIPAIFAAMGPVDSGLKPTNNDVWRFIRHIGAYLEAQRPRRDTPDHAEPQAPTTD